jgi:outer membrane protein OmpA-like peptidoglycan-associated protein
MPARRNASPALALLLVLASACGGAVPPPAAPESAAPAAPTAEKPADPPAAAPAEEPKAEAPKEAPKEPEPAAPAPTRAAIVCEAKAGSKPVKSPKLELTVDRARVDLDAHKLEVKLTRPACKVVLKVVGESGKVLAEDAQAFNGAPAGTTLAVAWSPAGAEPVMRIEVWGHDTDGNFTGVAISPWSVALAHEEVNFETDSDVVRPSEAPKLEASLGEINKILGKVQDKKPSLFIKGHTDTVGPPEHNLELSRRRARSIATWLRAHGLKIAIAYEGFGEHTPLVKTPDETAEPRNRRIDYFLSFDPPALPTGSVAFSWKGL